MSIRKLHVIISRNGSFDSSFVHSIFTSNKKANEFVGKYNRTVKKLKKLNPESIEDELRIREMELNEFIDNDPCIIYKVVYNRKDESVYGDICLGYRKDYLRENQLCVEHNRGDVILIFNVKSFEEAIKKLNDKYKLSVRIEDMIENFEGIL